MKRKAIKAVAVVAAFVGTVMVMGTIMLSAAHAHSGGLAADCHHTERATGTRHQHYERCTRMTDAEKVDALLFELDRGLVAGLKAGHLEELNADLVERVEALDAELAETKAELRALLDSVAGCGEIEAQTRHRAARMTWWSAETEMAKGRAVARAKGCTVDW